MCNEIFFIQKEILREVKTSETETFRIWCANSEFYGYSECPDEVDEFCKKLNERNTNKKVRFVVQTIRPLEDVNINSVR